MWVELAAGAGALVVGAFIWSAPRGDVATPGPEATPEQVVRAYIDAVNARDFETANTIDARPGDLGRFSRPMKTHDVEMGQTLTENGRPHVLFTADFDGGDGTVEDGVWGYYLERGRDGLWHIIDAGVA
ncbi:hypothetical protein EDD33_1752 [Nocardioides aurantiacus]|uniref:Mce-associated membrane protein n=1 Tax=Nocardioides aurantiacus TaxID=86796 RepID=A0A3N2CTN8_9ACTN|nr:hypothetical protein EDD33_1752 [Nocardioides aurantiacus]